MRNQKWPALRDILLFFGGMGGVFHETVLAVGERPTLLILFAAMMGLPAFLRMDGKSSLNSPPKEKEEAESKDGS